MDSIRSTEFFSAILTSLRLVLAIILLFAGIKKLKNPSAFVIGVLQYQILPTSWARWYGYLLPILEVVIGVLLLFGLWLVPTAILATLMFASFLIATSVNIIRETEVPCFCFGTGNLDKIGWHTVTRIFLLLAMSILLVFTAHLSFEMSALLHLPADIVIPPAILNLPAPPGDLSPGYVWKRAEAR